MNTGVPYYNMCKVKERSCATFRRGGVLPDAERVSGSGGGGGVRVGGRRGAAAGPHPLGLGHQGRGAAGSPGPDGLCQ